MADTNRQLKCWSPQIFENWIKFEGVELQLQLHYSILEDKSGKKASNSEKKHQNDFEWSYINKFWKQPRNITSLTTSQTNRFDNLTVYSETVRIVGKIFVKKIF